MAKKTGYLFLFLIMFWTACSRGPSMSVLNSRQIVQNVKQQYAPDHRTAIFAISVRKVGDRLVLSGTTDQPEARKDLLSQFSSNHTAVTDNIRLLPEASLQDSLYAVVNNATANLRAKPHFSAELTTQATLGMPLKLLEAKGDWLLVQTPDRYISWVQREQVEMMDNATYAAWKNAPKLIFTRMFGASYSKAGGKQEVSDLETGNVLKLIGRSGGYYQAEYPDGRIAYIHEKDAQPFNQWVASLKTDRASLVKTAKRFMGVPYLWGGTSAKGVDCSGFTKMVYLLNGMVLPRDANQQALAGQVVDSTRDFSKLLPGDLLFFGKKATDSTAEQISHVGMWIGNDEFIHSIGRVHISSMDPKSPKYDAYNLGRYIKSERILDSKTSDIIPFKKVVLE